MLGYLGGFNVITQGSRKQTLIDGSSMRTQPGVAGLEWRKEP